MCGIIRCDWENIICSQRKKQSRCLKAFMTQRDMYVGNYNTVLRMLCESTGRLSSLSLHVLHAYGATVGGVSRKGFLTEVANKLNPYLFYLIYSKKLISQSIQCPYLSGAEDLDQYHKVWFGIKRKQKEYIVFLFLFSRQIIFSCHMAVCKILWF